MWVLRIWMCTSSWILKQWGEVKLRVYICVYMTGNMNKTHKWGIYVNTGTHVWGWRKLVNDQIAPHTSHIHNRRKSHDLAAKKMNTYTVYTDEEDEAQLVKWHKYPPYVTQREYRAQLIKLQNCPLYMSLYRRKFCYLENFHKFSTPVEHLPNVFWIAQNNLVISQLN